VFDRVKTWFPQLTARLSRRIVVWVFLNILLVEVLVLAPNLYRHRRELLNELQHPTQANIELLARLSSDSIEIFDRSQYFHLLKTQPTILGGTLHQRDGTEIDRFGERPELQPNSKRTQQYFRNPNAPRLDVVYPFPLGDSDYFLVLRHDASIVNRTLLADIALTVIAAFLIATVATLTISIVLERTTITPILKLRRDLQRAGEAITSDCETCIAEDCETCFESSSYPHNDELGDTIAAFQTTINQIRNTIDRRKCAEMELATSSAEMQALFAAMTELIMVIDSEGRYRKIAPTNHALLYKPEAEILGKTFYEVLPPQTAKRFLQAVRETLSTRKTVEIEYSIHLTPPDAPPDSPTVETWFASRLSPISDDAVIWVARNVTDRKRTQEENQLLLTITQAIDAAPDFNTAIEVALERLCEATGWHYGEAWILSADRMALECTPTWYCRRDRLDSETQQRLEEFHAYSEGLTVLPDEGLPGRVWQTRTPIWIEDVSIDTWAVFLRESFTQPEPGKPVPTAGFGVPIVVSQTDTSHTESDILAVLVFFLLEARQQDRRWVNVVSALAAQLGTVMQQKLFGAELRALFAAMTDVILTIDAQGCYLKIAPTNPADPSYRSAHGILGKTLQDVFDPDRAHQFIGYIWQSLNERTTLEVEYTLDVNGKARWFAARISPISEDVVLWVARDISDRKLAEEQLAEKDSYLRLILDSIPQQVFWKDVDLVFRGCNKNWAKAARLRDPQEVVGKTDYDLLGDPHMAEFFRQKDRHVLATGQPELHVVANKVHPGEEGEQIWLDINRLPVRDADDRIIGILGVIEDITLRKQALDDLHAEREKSERLLLNVLPKPIAEKLKEQQGSISTGFEVATVLFADIVGFTPLSARLSATELVELLNQIFSSFDRLAEVHDLEKIKTIGDAYMVVGGIPLPCPDRAESIAEMALDMQATISQFISHNGEAFQLRIGINTGPVVAGAIGIKKFIYDLWGDTVNVASRMESMGCPGRVQVTRATYDLLKDRYNFERRGQVVVKGKGRMETYWLVGRKFRSQRA